MPRRGVLTGALAGAALASLGVAGLCSGSAWAQGAAAGGSVYVVQDGQVLGPFDEAGLRARIRSQSEAARILVWYHGLAEWMPAAQAPGLAVFVASLPADAPFDFAGYLVGVWHSKNRAHDFGDGYMIGSETIRFRADGTFDSSYYAEDLNVFSIPLGPVITPPGGVPVRPPERLVDLSETMQGRISGTFEVRPLEGGRHRIALKGDLRSTDPHGKVRRSEWSDIWDVVRVTQTHFSTLYGEDFRRR